MSGEKGKAMGHVSPDYERDIAEALICGLLVGILLTALAFVLFWPKTNPCDVNRDGKVTATDLLIVRRELLGLPQSADATGPVPTDCRPATE